MPAPRACCSECRGTPTTPPSPALSELTLDDSFAGGGSVGNFSRNSKGPRRKSISRPRRSLEHAPGWDPASINRRGSYHEPDPNAHIDSSEFTDLVALDDLGSKNGGPARARPTSLDQVKHSQHGSADRPMNAPTAEAPQLTAYQQQQAATMQTMQAQAAYQQQHAMAAAAQQRLVLLQQQAQAQQMAALYQQQQQQQQQQALYQLQLQQQQQQQQQQRRASTDRRRST